MKSAKVTKFSLVIAVTVFATIAFAAEGGAVSLVPLAQAIVLGIGILGTAIAQMAIGVAAVGAVAEDRRNFGTSFIFMLIPETLVIFGFVGFILLG